MNHATAAPLALANCDTYGSKWPPSMVKFMPVTYDAKSEQSAVDHQAIAQAAPSHKFHLEVRAAAAVAECEDLDDVRMMKPRD